MDEQAQIASMQHPQCTNSIGDYPTFAHTHTTTTTSTESDGMTSGNTQALADHVETASGYLECAACVRLQLNRGCRCSVRNRAPLIPLETLFDVAMSTECSVVVP
jgi:hypothetical protein